jgi:hypothetical protein
MAKRRFKELAKSKIQDDCYVVISKNDLGSYTIAQQITIEAGRKMNIYLKGAFHISSLERLYALRDALNEAITREENGFD